MLFAQSVSYRYFFHLCAKFDQYFCFNAFYHLFARFNRNVALWTERHAPHPFDLVSPDEDEWSLISYGSSQLLGLVFPLLQPGSLIMRLVDFDSQLTKNEQEAIFGIAYRQLIQRHLYFEKKIRGKPTEMRFLSKNPTFTLRITSLLRYFPTAHILVVVRDPNQAIPSMVSYITAWWRFVASPTMNYPFRDELQGMCSKHYTYPLELATTQFTFVKYEQLLQSPDSIVQRILKDLQVNDFASFKLPNNVNFTSFVHQYSIASILGLSQLEFENKHREVFERYPEYRKL